MDYYNTYDEVIAEFKRLMPGYNNYVVRYETPGVPVIMHMMAYNGANSPAYRAMVEVSPDLPSILDGIKRGVELMKK